VAGDSLHRFGSFKTSMQNLICVTLLRGYRKQTLGQEVEFTVGYGIFTIYSVFLVWPLKEIGKNIHDYRKLREKMHG
jgi:hypothetical protein